MNSSDSPVMIRAIDLDDDTQGAALLELLDEYAASEIGGGEALATRVRANLLGDLRSHSQYRGWLAWLDQRPVGLLNAFIGYSTFDGLPLLNVHDLAVTPSCQGQGIGRRLLETAVDWSRRQGFGRVTLEVRSDNVHARRLYGRLGFEPHVPVGETMEFLKCSLINEGTGAER
ncbi:MAG: GNAT family N-acetyltransferase [Planctomycetales bacterium]|nr:GNAT family N-acetyltransferase [Planctomycetales bacterium]